MLQTSTLARLSQDLPCRPLTYLITVSLAYVQYRSGARPDRVRMPGCRRLAAATIQDRLRSAARQEQVDPIQADSAPTEF
jgi:hypothetical protein